MVEIQKNIKEFALVGFLLLAVLFGMQIMSFIFGNFGEADFLKDVIITTTNETDAWINSTGYTLDQASVRGFNGGTTITIVYNATDDGEGAYNLTILSGNYTVNANTGVVTNASTAAWTNVSISYTSVHKTEAEIVTDETTNDSLHAIGAYAEQSETQFTTLGIAITLVILVAVFVFFWIAFMAKKKDEGPGGFS